MVRFQVVLRARSGKVPIAVASTLDWAHSPRVVRILRLRHGSMPWSQLAVRVSGTQPTRANTLITCCKSASLWPPAMVRG